MEKVEIEEILKNGENQQTIFKEYVKSPEKFASDIVALANSNGGNIFIGVDEKGTIKGLSDEEAESTWQLVLNSTFDYVKPSLYPKLNYIEFNDKYIIVVNVSIGVNKPYCTNKGEFLVRKKQKNVKLTKKELNDLFIESNKKFSDQRIFKDSSSEDIDLVLFKDYYYKRFGVEFEADNLFKQTLENMKLSSNNHLNLTSILFFSKNTTKFFQLSQIVAVSFFGNDTSGFVFRDSENIEGNIQTLFHEGMAFLKRNLTDEESQNLELPVYVLEELLVNALIHRSYHLDYLISGNIRISIFDNRIEFENPGCLVDNLTTAQITKGKVAQRNSLLSHFAQDIIPFRGVGLGIISILSNYPEIEFFNDVEGDQFKVIIYRPEE